MFDRGVSRSECPAVNQDDNLKKKILFLAKSDRQGASTRYRVYHFQSLLEGAGFDTQIIPQAHSSNKITRPLRRFREFSVLFQHALEADIIFIQKRLFPLSFLRKLSASGKPIVFDYDDAIFTTPSGTRSAWTRSRVIRRLRQTFEVSSLVFAGNKFLAEFASQFADRVVILPTAIDLAKYKTKDVSQTDRINLGWIGSKVNFRYLRTLENVLAQLDGKIPDLSLTVVSDGEFLVSNMRVDNRSWSEESEMRDLHCFDVGLMPLEDDVWTNGKCALKALQYMAAGIPAVCSAVGANCEVIRDGVNGFLCSSEQDWIATLERLASHPGLREEIGLRGRRTVEDQYSLQVVAEQMIQNLRTLV